MKRSIGDATAPILVTHRDHTLSLALAVQMHTLDQFGAKVSDARLLAPGLVAVDICAGDDDGYGVRTWPLHVGGEGVGDEPSVASALGTPPRAPVAVRFATSYFAMSGVDDAGFVDASFFIGLGNPPSLKEIVARAIEWLVGADEPSEHWRAAASHTRGKQRCIDSYRPRARCPSLMSDQATLQAEWLAPAFRALLTCRTHEERTATCRTLLHADCGAGGLAELAAGSGIFAFDLFTPLLCALLLDDVDGFEASELPRRRPNTMNRAGLIVNEIGMDALMTALLNIVISPLAAALYTSEVFSSSIDHHHSFVVQYSKATGGDRGLDLHHDASEVTLNVCLGRGPSSVGEPGFHGSGLRFCGRFGGGDHRRTSCVHAHTPGRGVIHLGRQRHGADDLIDGERLNLIVWARSSAFRGAAAFGHVPPDGYPREAGTAPLALYSSHPPRAQHLPRRF